VYGLERRVLLRHYVEQGWSKAAIARELGLDRGTIYRWIASGQLDRDLDAERVRYRPRPPRPGQLDPYKPVIQARLAEYPALTSMRLLAEVRAAGYTGCRSQLSVFVQGVRPRPAVEPVVRFETGPGQQAQVDFARVAFPWGVRYALVVVLGYSRLLWLRFSARQDMRALTTGLEAAFTAFGGVPREVLFDQMRAVITRDLRAEGGRLVENLEFLRFARHWGFRPRACRPYRAQTKGKVERPIRYLRQSFVYGRVFAGDRDLQAQADAWLRDVANARVHQTTQAVPAKRFVGEEQAVLLPLATRPYRSLYPTLGPAPSPRPVPTLARVAVERRALGSYAQLAQLTGEFPGSDV
jgi:transposase